MRGRTRKVFPPGTFLPTAARVVAILHLCIAFTLILWYASQPFMGRYFTVKSRLKIFESVFDNPHFQTLPDLQKIVVMNKYNEISTELDVSFGHKCLQSIYVLVKEIPTYEQAWLVLSVILPIYLLKRREGSWQAAWLLPILCLAFCIENRFQGNTHSVSKEEGLFPSEAYIVQRYLDKPLSENILEQQEQLIEGWKRYLVMEWSKVGENFEEKVNSGEFEFTLARIDRTELPQTLLVNKRLSFFMLALYLFWNVYFAWTFFIHRRSIEIEEKLVISSV